MISSRSPLFVRLFGRHCQCCGDQAVRWDGKGIYAMHARCRRHVDRNPCAIEGCRCTTAKGYIYASDRFLCTKHWRPLTRPAERRIYSRIIRQAKKRDKWTMADHRRLSRVWSRIVARARSRAAGDIDMAEVNKLFGWD